MARSFTLFSRALSRLRMRSGSLCEGIRVELFGTTLGWQPGEARGLSDIAAKWGIGDLVREEPGRLSYRRSLELLLQSDGALIFGVEDAGYMPSKLFSYALSGRPLLATLHGEGPAFSLFQSISKLGHVLWFGQNDDMPLDGGNERVGGFRARSSHAADFRPPHQYHPVFGAGHGTPSRGLIRGVPLRWPIRFCRSNCMSPSVVS